MAKRKRGIIADPVPTEVKTMPEVTAVGATVHFKYPDGQMDYAVTLPLPEQARNLAQQVQYALKAARDSLAAEYGMTPEEAKALHTSHVEDVKEEEP